MSREGPGTRVHEQEDTRAANEGLVFLDALVLLLVFIGFFLGPLKLLGASWLAYLAPDALAALILLVLVSQRLAGRKPLLARSLLTVPLVLVAGYCVLEMANPDAPFIRSVLGLRSWVLYLCFYFVGFYGLRSIRQIERLYVLLLGLGVLTAFYGLYQWRKGPEGFATWSDAYGHYARVMWAAGSGGGIFRAFSTFVLPNTFGSNMAIIMLLAFGVIASPLVDRFWRLVATAAFGVMGLGIAVSGSRGPVAFLVIGLGAGLLFVPGARRLRVAVAGLLLGGIVVLLVLLVLGSVVNERFATLADPNAFFWKWFIPLRNGISIAAAHPFGMGLGFTAGVPTFISSPALRELPVTNIDSGYGSAAAELGFVGLALFVYFALKVGLSGFRTWLALPGGRLRDLLLGPALLATIYPIVTVVSQPQATLPSSVYSWLLVGMLMKAPSLIKERVDANQLFRA